MGLGVWLPKYGAGGNSPVFDRFLSPVKVKSHSQREQKRLRAAENKIRQVAPPSCCCPTLGSSTRRTCCSRTFKHYASHSTFTKENIGIHWNGFLSFKLKSPVVLESTVAIDFHAPTVIRMMAVDGNASISDWFALRA